jgi:DNA-binding MarR family transcriptional regulator
MVNKKNPPAAALAFSDLSLESFRLTGRLLAKGDELGQDLDMTSARWQVLGTLMLAGEAITVAEIARRMDLARQSVQRIADWLAAVGYVDYVDNPNHSRWKLVAPTKQGQRVYRRLEERRMKWVEDVVSHLNIEQLQLAANTLRHLRLLLKSSDK